MIGLDTNILVRFFAKDNPAQFQSSLELLQSLTPGHPGFVSLVVFAEIAWVMRSRYRASRTELAEYLKYLLDLEDVVVENPEAATQALGLFTSTKADFADCLIERCGHVAGCLRTYTFDEGASKATGMSLLKGGGFAPSPVE